MDNVSVFCATDMRCRDVFCADDMRCRDEAVSFVQNIQWEEERFTLLPSDNEDCWVDNNRDMRRISNNLEHELDYDDARTRMYGI